MKLNHSFTSCTKIRSKWIKDLNMRLNTTKLLEETIGSTLSDINSNDVFFNPFPRIMEIKTKISTWDLCKLRAFTQQRKPKTRQIDKIQCAKTLILSLQQVRHEYHD